MLKNHPDGRLQANYLQAREGDGTEKWYVVIQRAFTADDKALTAYGPRPDPAGTFRPVYEDTAKQKYFEKTHEKGYRNTNPDALPDPVKTGLLRTIRDMTGAAHARILPCGRIEVSMRPRRGSPRTRQATHVWL